MAFAARVDKMKIVFLICALIMPILVQAQGLTTRNFDRLLERGGPADQLLVGTALYRGSSEEFGKNEEQGKSLIEASSKKVGPHLDQAIAIYISILVNEGDLEKLETLLANESLYRNLSADYYAGISYASIGENEKAIEYLQKTVEGNSNVEFRIQAAEALLRIYSDSSRNIFDETLSLNWAKYAAELNSSYGASYLGWAYKYGVGVEIDPELTFQNWRVATTKRWLSS